jgi:hypothetical protein
MEDDPFAALEALATRVRAGQHDEDPFAILDSLSAAPNTSSANDLESLFSELEQSCSSLSTVVAGFFAEEYGASLGSDDVLADRGLGEEHLSALESFLVSSVGLQVPADAELASLGEGVRFWALIAHVDKLARRQKLDVAAALKDVLVPIEVPADYQCVVVHDGVIDPPALQKKEAVERIAEEQPVGSATPKTRRRNAVEKGIQKFQGMTLRGRTPQAQSEKQKATQAQRPTVRANVILPK